MIRRRRWLWPLLGLLLLVGSATSTSTQAHEIRPALLTITERSPGWFDVTWKVPVRGDQVLPIAPVLPDSLTAAGLAVDAPGAGRHRREFDLPERRPAAGRCDHLDRRSERRADRCHAAGRSAGGRVAPGHSAAVLDQL